MPAFMVAQYHAKDDNPSGKPLFTIQGFSQEYPPEEDGDYGDQVNADGGPGY